MVRFSVIALVCVVSTAALVLPASAVTVPFTEDFPTSNSNWGTSASAFTGATYVASGGPSGAGDSFISTNFTFAAGAQGQTVFRGQDNFNSSNDAFVGDWINGHVADLSFWIRQNSDTPLRVGVRFATSANFPGANIVDQVPVQPNVWTLVTIPISETPGANFIYTSEGSSFASVFNNLGNMQILAQLETLSPGTVVTFSLDKVSIVPEPSTLLLAGFGLASAGAVAWRRRRSAIGK